MNHDEEVALLNRCMRLAAESSTQIAEEGGSSPVSRYIDEQGYQAEVAGIFRKLPTPVAHVSQLSASDSFLTVETHHGSVLVTRDAQGTVRAFHNVCRHRGTQLVETPAGCSRRFSCPYHAWTYTNDGKLVGVPHGATAFPDLDRGQAGLVPLNIETRYGFIWLTADEVQLEDFLDGLHSDLEWLGLENHAIFASDTRVWQCNWKIIAEGGLESYHFRQAHASTIAPFFYDNLSIYDRFGPHFRTVLPKRNLEALKESPQSSWRLRDVTHMTYALLPMTTFLVQADHVVWLTARPLAVDQTEVTMRTLVPADDLDRAEHWQTNHDITAATLNEDFSLGESIQRGFINGANQVLTFGRNEGALVQLKDVIDTLQ